MEAAVAASSKEAVTGNVLIWFLCAVAFLKVSQKIDSFMASLGINVGHTGGSLIIVDIFDSRIYKNANMAILGTSGAGKTFTMQLMALRMRRKGIQVFIVAPLKGHEFHRACTNIGGEFIQISPASKNCINVMEIRRADKSVDELLDGPGGVDKSLLAAKIQRLHIFFSLLIPDMNHEERQLLDDALIRAYAKLGITHENSTLDDPDRPGQYRTMPVLGDLYEVLKESQDTRRLANILNRLVNGSAICATQDLNDFFALEDGKYGKGIINNVKTKILLNLEDEEAQRVQSILHLSRRRLWRLHTSSGAAGSSVPTTIM